MTCPLGCASCARQTAPSGWPSPEPPAWASWLMIAMAVTAIGVLCAFLTGCASRPRSAILEWAAAGASRTVSVQVVAWPAEPEVDCYLAEDPAEAKVSDWPEESDVFKRTMTPRRETEDLIGNVNDLHQLVSTMRACIVRLMDRTQKGAP